MSSDLHKIYYRLPVLLQNVVLSIYGLRIQRIRHGRGYKEFLQRICRHDVLSKQVLEQLQLQTFKKILHHSQAHIPYYKEKIKKISPREIRNITDLKKLPILEKDVLRTLPESLVDERYDKRKLLIIHTTGTTGTPLKIYCTPEIRKKNYAFYTRFLMQVGINYSGKRATFGGRIIVSHNQMRPPFWRHSYFQKNILFSSYHLSDKNIPFYISALRKIKPEYIDAYPSSIFAIANYAKKRGISLRGITKAITTSAETLFSGQRELIEDTFGVRIFDQYGAAEMCVFIAQCSHGRYHVHSDYAIVEFLRQDGSYAAPGEEAEIVCTSLINEVMPLIRYRIGDRAVLSDRCCECGSPFPVVEKIVGRTDDVVLTPDGRKIGRLSPVLKGFPVKQAQYIQKKRDELVVVIVKDHGYQKEHEIKIKKELEKRVGSSIGIVFAYRDKIALSKGGKFKSTISTVDCTESED